MVRSPLTPKRVHKFQNWSSKLILHLVSCTLFLLQLEAFHCNVIIFFVECESISSIQSVTGRIQDVVPKSNTFTGTWLRQWDLAVIQEVKITRLLGFCLILMIELSAKVYNFDSDYSWREVNLPVQVKEYLWDYDYSYIRKELVVGCYWAVPRWSKIQFIQM